MRVPKSRCKKCRHFNEWYGCHLDDLTPCPHHREMKPWQIYLRIVGIPLALLAAFIAAMLLLNGCAPKPTESDGIKQWSAVELLRGDELSKWDKLIMAIALTESRFNPSAVGDAEDYGILQITPIYVKELNRLGYDYSHADSFDIGKSIEMFNAMQSVKNPSKDIDLAILYHNKSSVYKARVKANLELIERYEEIRKRL